jgi:hypothetical protein
MNVGLARVGRIGLSFVVLGCLSAMAGACSSASGLPEGASNSAVVSCSGPEQIAKFQQMLAQPIVPSRNIGGLDLRGGDSWTGLTVDDAEHVLCASTPFATDVKSDQDPSVTTAMAGWGLSPNFSLTVEYDKTTRKIDFFQLNDGYKGALEFASRPTALGDPSKPNPFGQHHYSVGIGRQILRDGQPWQLNWFTSCSESTADCWDKQSTELFDALMFTFAPELPSTQTSCKAAQTCLASTFVENDMRPAVFGARPLGIYFHVPNAVVGQLEASTPDYVYGFLVKQMPFSAANMMLKLDDEGPVGTAAGLGDRQATCTMKMGMPYQSFLGECVQVVTDHDANDLLKKKLLGGLTRSVTSSGAAAATGTWIFDVAGLNPNFNSERFDETEPPTTARATEISLDLRASGRVLNEYAADGNTLTLAGTAAVYREYARVLQELAHDKMDPSLPRFPLGAAECLLPANADAKTWRPARGCTGLEQLVTPQDPATVSDPNLKRISIGVHNATSLGLRTALKPGNPSVAFCADPDVREHCWGDLGGDVVDPLGMNGPLWETTRKQILHVLGGDNPANVPAALLDRDLFVQVYTTALVKYLRVAAHAPADLSDPALAVEPSDIVIEHKTGDLVTVKYKNRLEYTLMPIAGNLQTMTFR